VIISHLARATFAIAVVAGAVQPAAARQDMPADYQAVLKTLGRTGDFKDGVLKVNLPRNDIAVTIKGLPAPTAFGFGGWLALTKGDGGHDVMMGDLVLTEDEVNPVLSAILANGLEATALHNHFFWENPRIFYMHVHGHGLAADLATKVKPALELMGRGTAPPSTAAAPAPATPAAGSLDAAALAKIIGYPGDQNGAVFKITIGRPDIQMREMGAVINARMGLNTWAAFAGTNDDAMVAGDVAMLENEVTPVLAALRRHNLNVVAMHNHMVNARPVVIFLHYWGQGRAAALATGVRAALDVQGKVGSTASRSPDARAGTRAAGRRTP
jgi:hypothetical protein